MKLFHNKKILTSLIIIVALLVGFGSAFMVAGLADRDKAPNTASHDDDDKAEHLDHANYREDTDYGGGQNASITADDTIKNVKADKNIDLLTDKASPEETYLTVGQVLQFNTKDDNKHRIALGQGGTEHEHTSATNSGDFGADEAWRVRFDKVGTYFFHDHHNPNINVLVVVYQPGAKQGIY